MGARVIIVDDEPRNIALVEAMLEPCGYDLSHAPGGREALAKIKAAPPDLVIADLRMPGFDGIDLLTHVRAEESLAHVPVIVMTAHSEREKRLAAVEAGADEFLEKPIDRALLHARVKTLLALKQSRDELAARHAALLALQKEQREMMQFIVHDLRTPLMVVKTGVAFAGENLERDPRESLEALADARDSIERVNDLVSDMLAVARLEQSDLPLELRATPIRPLLDRIAQSFARKAKASAVALEAHCDELSVRADRSLLQRVIENILDNSLRHTPPSGRIAIESERARGNDVRIAVCNSGPPVPLEERESIFGKFVRGRSASSRPGAVGMGLYFCRRVIEAHGGKIRIDQSPVWPTQFLIELPAAEPS